MGTELSTTPLYAWHVAQRARIVDFAGWAMPLQYTSIVQEHLATRSAVGLFDISHMGRISIHGHAAAAWLDKCVTRRVADMKPGQVRYGMIADRGGAILDDVLVYHALGTTSPRFQMVVNAGNRARVMAWLRQQQPPKTDLTVEDVTSGTAMIAVQGPKAVQLVGEQCEGNLQGLRYYRGMEAEVVGVRCQVSRTGYTGEDGVELMMSQSDAQAVWQTLAEKVRSAGGCAAGLGCRDTLRLEAAMPLYGHELTEAIDPWEAGLGFAVDLDKHDFCGRDGLRDRKQRGGRRHRVGLSLSGRRVPRQGYAIERDGETVGKVTSGTFSPTLKCPIAMGLVAAGPLEAGTQIHVDVRGRREAASVVPLPFYKRSV